MRIQTLLQSHLLPAVVLGLFVALPAPAQDPTQEPTRNPAEQPAAAPAEESAAADAAEAEAPAKMKVALLRPSGHYEDLPEIAFDPAALLLGGGAQPKPFFRLLDAIKALAAHESDTVLLDLSGSIGLNLAQLREVERAFGPVHAAGKKVYGYVENASPVTVQLMALCDRVLMADMGMIDFRSPALNIMHVKDALDLLGVQAEMTRVGEFKGAVEPYVLSEMSAPLREHYLRMLDSMNADIIRRVATGRGLDTGAVRELQKQRLLPAKAALAAGLVDALVPWRGARSAVVTDLGVDDVELVDATPKKARRSRDLFALMRDLLRSREEEEIEDPEIVVLHLSGGIVDGRKAQPGSMVSGPAVEQIDQLADNDNVKGVVVRINSPGGSATASEAIRLALQRLAAEKPVVFSMGRVAASGGYWITAIGEPILAEAGTITGSIGVFSLRVQLGPLMRRIGLNNELVALDDGPEMDAPDKPWSSAARARIQSVVDDIYDRFIGIVAASRQLPGERVREIAGGRVWSGSQAKELGLVDLVGGVDDALAMVRKAADAGDDVEVRHLPEPRDFASTLFEQMFDARALAAAEPRLALLLQDVPYFDVLWTALRDAFTDRAGAGVPRVYAMLPGDLTVR